MNANALMMRPIPKTGELLPVVGLGTWRTFDVGAGSAERAGPATVLKLLAESGASVVDTSPMYGAAETVVGDLSRELASAERLFIATKVWTRGREAGIRQMETSFKRLRVNRVDLMQVHNLLDWEIHMQILREWKEEGRVRYLGVTHYAESAYPELERAIRTGDIDFVQLNYSIVSRSAERSLLPLAQERGVAVLVNRPFEEGGLISRLRGTALPGWAAELGCVSWAQVLIKFVLSHPAVTCVIPATAKAAHLRENLHAGRLPLPDATSREKIVRELIRL